MERRTSIDKTKYNKATHEWEEEDLDEEMEEIFHPANDYFSLAELISRDSEPKINVDEKDFDLHRRESFQYHQPLHKLYHKHKKSSHKGEKSSSEASPRAKSTVSDETVKTKPSLDTHQETEETEEPHEDEPLISQNLVPPEPPGAPQVPDSKDKVQFYVGSSTSLDSAAASSSKKPLKPVLRTFPKGERRSSTEFSPSFKSPSSLKEAPEDALSSLDADDSSKKPAAESESAPAVAYDKEKTKVTFLLGEESQNDLKEKVVEGVPEPSKKASKHSRRRSTKRKHHGFNVGVNQYNTVLEPEEAETLQKADIDDMASHRFEDPKGIHRSKIKGKFWPSFLKKDEPLFNFYKKKIDLQPHDLFVELHELQPIEYSCNLEWKETARWIKYEEDCEEGLDRWGKPHVPPLGFHSLIKLRQCLEAGTAVLDLEESDFLSIATRAVDAMVQTDQFQPELRDKILRLLMLRHRHVNEKPPPALRRNSAGYGNLNLLSHDKNRSPLFSKTARSKSVSDANHALNNGENLAPQETSILMEEDETIPVEITPSAKRKSFSVEKSPESGLLRKVPQNSEGVVVLVGQLEELDKPACTFVRLAEGRIIPNILEIPIKIRFIFVIFGPVETTLNFHEIGRAVGSLMSNPEFRIQVYKATSMKDLLSAINKFLDSSTVVPPGKWDRTLLPLDEIRRKSLIQIQAAKEPPKKPTYDPLKRTKRCFGGLFEDIKHRYPFYKSDILDGLTFQCLASIIFIYFAAVSGAIAFGGLLAEKTELNIGVSETLIGTAACGVLFSLLAGQPLIIIGTTGPLLLFDEMLFQLRDQYSAPFLVMRVWVGIWTLVIATVIVAAEGSVLVKYFSRFVQEIFATIISLLFIFESLSKLYKIFVENPLLADYCGLNDTVSNGSSVNDSSSASPKTPQPNTALLSTILMIGTFYIAFFLRHFRNSKFLGRSARRALGDFGVPIAIIIMVIIDVLIPDTYTQTLLVPEGLSPSTSRSWLISPLPVQVWEIFISFVGGLLIFILLFMETQICELIISKKQLRKGSGFHIDMILVGLMQMISGFIGGPWQCAATVRSISHVSSLIVWSKTHAPGELPHIVEVKEQRLTNLLVSILIGISVLLAPILRLVPVAVLFGVFLYMGISALSGVHLYERFILLFMPEKHHPDFPFVRKVRTKKMHLYTAIQIVCIAVLWIIKTYIAPAFPFGLLGLVVVYSQLNRLFTKQELVALDGEAPEDEADDEEDDPDFYEQIVA